MLGLNYQKGVAKMQVLIDIFLSFFQIGLFSFGGGYAALSLIKHHVVDLHAWLTLGQFTDLITISQMTPGPIALNSATFVGLQVAGIQGAIVATIANVLPSFIVVSILSYIYFKFRNIKTMSQVLLGMRPVVVAMIASAGLVIFIGALWGGEVVDLGSTNILNVILFVVSLFALRKYKMDPILVMTLSGITGILMELISSLI